MGDPEIFAVEGLREPVELLLDRWGVPHLYARTEQDVFLAQGFNAARERLFQIDLWRRRGLGLLAEVFGPAYVERDRAARLFLYRGDMRSEWLAYGSATKAVVSAFSAGVNAFVDLCSSRPELLPVEFDLLGYQPSRWQPEDVARIRSHGLFYNLEQEVARAQMLRDFGPEVEDLRQVREPSAPLVVPEGLDLDAIPDDVLHVYRLATSQPVLGAPQAEVAGPRTDPEGSNNWVVGASRTATGRPLLANDPHRGIGMPSLRYISHLSAPGLDVVGAGEPALPGISIGHNGAIAFGLTIFAIDQEDLYVYETNPADRDEYRYQGHWERMSVVRQRVPVDGAEPVEITLRWTRHGPVIHDGAAGEPAFAVRAAWLEPGMAPYLGSMEYMRARSCEAFTTAMNRWGAPGENQVYADPAGTIGWRPGGLVPVRPNWDGTLPVPGDGRYEWDGFHDADQLPSCERPAADWFATANEMNLPADYPNATRTISYDWYHRYRHDRIAEVLGSAVGVTAQDCLRLQADYVNVPSRRFCDELRRISTGGEAGEALSMLQGWDSDETTDSAAAALYQVWYRRHLRPALLSQALRQLVPADRLELALERLLPDEEMAADVRADLQVFEALREGDEAAGQALREILLSTLLAAHTEVAELLGPDPRTWAWGRLHHAAPVHPAAGLLDAALAWRQLPDVARGGSGDTVGSTAYDPQFRQTAGATFRIVVDVGDWDRSLAMNSPGQSGRPEDPHYADLYASWAGDAAFPLLYSRAEIEGNLDRRIMLVPPDDDVPRAR